VIFMSLLKRRQAASTMALPAAFWGSVFIRDAATPGNGRQQLAALCAALIFQVGIGKRSHRSQVSGKSL
jgi:hypothetical protein